MMNHNSSTQSNLGHLRHSFRWESRRELPEGGYLNDLWILEKRLVCTVVRMSNATIDWLGVKLAVCSNACP